MVQVDVNVETLNAEFEAAYPQDVLKWAVETYGASLAVVTSLQPTGIVTLHMLSEMGLKPDILTLDTGLLFPETYALINDVESRLGIHITRVRPVQSVAEQEGAYGPKLWERDPDLCCNMRKVVPLAQALTGYDAWISGLRRDQSSTRRATPIISWDRKNQKVKLSPLATWTEEMVWTYLQAHELPYNPLHDQNYPTIGCYTCTCPVLPGSSDLRAGRWAGISKTECGIHLTNA
jgi:phosphoadenosine phosphosulfate reductase